MQLIADSGSTKTDWVLIRERKKKLGFQSTGINPYFKSDEQIFSELHPVVRRYIEPEAVKRVDFYGAGCSSHEKTETVRNAFERIFPAAEIFVGHDMLAAARALLWNKPGIACILGTGSNSCFYDGKKITKSLFSLGYMFGDEGSGAHIGKTFIKKHLKKKIPVELQKAFEKKYNVTYEEILNNVYKKPNPNKYLASFTYFISENLNHPYVENHVEQCFDEFIREQVCKFTNYRSYPVNCTGSIAFYFRNNLIKALQKHDITPGKIIRSPMDDLIRFHVSGIHLA